MRAILGRPDDRPDCHRLFLLPENDRDRKVLERLVARYELTNLGRHAETGCVLHVGVELRERER